MQIGSMNVNSIGAGRRMDLSRLPAEHRESGMRGVGIFFIFFSLLWGGLPTLALIGALRKGGMEPGLWFLLLFTLIGGGLLVAGLKMATTRRTLRFSRDQVGFEERSWLGHRQWSEPLDRFPGLRARSEYHSGGKNRSSYTLYFIELFHPDPHKRLRLHESRSPDGLRALHEEYCRQLGRPALEGEGADMVERRPEDLDKSVAELAREGKLKVDFDPAQPPPAKVSLKVEGDQLRIELPPPHISMGGLLIGLLVPSLFMWISFGRPGTPKMIGIIGALFLVLMVYGFIWQRITRAVIRVGAHSIELGRRSPWGESRGRTLDIRTLESVRIGRRVDNQGQPGVLLVTDAGTNAIGEGQPKPTLDWLRNCILAVAARGR